MFWIIASKSRGGKRKKGGATPAEPAWPVLKLARPPTFPPMELARPVHLHHNLPN